MSKILLIEPHKILRQAIALCLYPEHEIEVQENAKGLSVESLAGYDLIVVDGVALREIGQLSAELSRAIEGTRAKVFWLEEGDGPRPVKSENLVVVKKPIDREAFQAAVTNCLSPPQKARETKSAAPASATTREGPAKRTKRRAEDPRQPTLQFIDLVEVVEEEPSAKPERRGRRKSK